MAFEKRLLRGTLLLERVDETGGWRKLRNEETHLCFSPNIMKMVTSAFVWLGIYQRG
jgi:hypothetical protein